MYRTLSFVALLALSGGAQAQLSATDAWARSTVPVQKATGAFATLQTKEPVNVVRVESEVAGMAELHEMRMEGDVARMRPVQSLRVVPGAPVHLAPGGYHIMLMGLKRQLKAGERIPLVLHFQRADNSAGKLSFQAEVRALDGGDTHSH